MNKMIANIFGGLRIARPTLDGKMKVLLFDHIQMRCNSKMTRPKYIEKNIYKKKEEAIGLSGYCLLGIPIATFVLGTWQVKRLKWKLDLIENLKNRTTAEPTDLPVNLDELKDKDYYQFRVKGTYLYEKEFLIGPRSLIVNGKALSESGGGLIGGKSGTGYYVITPFKLEDRDVTIMVNRGWIPKKDRTTFKRENKITNPTEIVGIFRTTEKRPPFVLANAPEKGVWHFRDVDAMAKMSETDPVYIELLAEYGTPHGPIGGQTRVNLRNEHLSYIFTWYTLSICTSYMWYRHFLYKF